MTVEEAKALNFGAGSQESQGDAGETDTTTGGDTSQDEAGEVDLGEIPGAEQAEAEGTEQPEQEAGKADAEGETEPEAEGEQEAQPEGGRKGPPKVMPYERFQEKVQETKAERAARLAAERRVMELEAELEPFRGKSQTPKPPKQLTEEQKFLREAVEDDIGQVRSEVSKVTRFIEDQRDREEGEAFWSQEEDVDPEVKSAVEEQWKTARKLSASKGVPLQFTREHLLLLEEGARSRETRRQAKAATSEQKRQADAQRKQVAAVNRTATRGVTKGPTVGRPGPKPFDKMSRAEQEDALKDIVF